MGDDYWSHEYEPPLCVVLHPYEKEKISEGSRTPRACLEEAVSLVKAIRMECVYNEAIGLKSLASATLMGTGTIERLAEIISGNKAEVVVVDYPLSPRQQRNLEKAWNVKVIDRTGLILEIFADRAQTAEGKLQVELAQCEYQKSRLVRAWTHLERQRATGKTGGPGEKQIELDKRLIGERIAKLKDELKIVEKRRKVQKSKRDSVPYPVVALVGYTNAGKSTLFNRLTESDVMAKDMLFATLDPTMREVKLPSGRRIILSDTVGFISNLPTQLIAAFKATLEEVLEADLILHVNDISSPSSLAERKDVLSILEELGIDIRREGYIVDVLNKIDMVKDINVIKKMATPKENECYISAIVGSGIDGLLAKIDTLMGREAHRMRVVLPVVNGRAVSWLYENGEVHHTAIDDETQMMTMDVSLSAFKKGQCLSRFGNDVTIVD